ncbi:MAG: mobile mystery protein A [Gemmatimonadota bacterium]
MSRIDDLRVRQLDEALLPFAELRHRPPPSQGWARTIRETLGISLRQLSERSGLSKTAVRSAEGNESRGTVQFNSLRTLAEAMDCDLVYALVPRTSLAESIRRQAERIASGLVHRVSDSMELEQQGVSSAENERQIQELTAELMKDRGRDFWDV